MKKHSLVNYCSEELSGVSPRSFLRRSWSRSFAWYSSRWVGSSGLSLFRLAWPARWVLVCVRSRRWCGAFVLSVARRSRPVVVARCGVGGWF